MTKHAGWLAMVVTLLMIGFAAAQHPIVDMVANNVAQKYQQATCEQLWEQRGKPKSPQEQEIVQILRADAQLRTEFINKVAAPVVNKMFECGLVP